MGPFPWVLTTIFQLASAKDTKSTAHDRNQPSLPARTLVGHLIRQCLRLCPSLTGFECGLRLKVNESCGEHWRLHDIYGVRSTARL